jgi:tRNA A-37 threonylcarbamoyl transferase component Bud32
MADSPLAHSPTISAGAPVGDGAPRLPPGTRVGEYVVDRFLGAGAMGEVYGGHHPVIGKKVAIKILRRELATSEEAVERFTREARAGNQVEHPNVIDVFSYGRLDDGRMYLMMDLCPGTSLRAKLADGALATSEALEILQPIAEALDAAHARGVIHRDLKPDNIMVSTSGPLRVFVLDFGIAKLVSKANEGKLGNGTLTGQGTWLGTPAYMAPEQWSTDGAGPASDRYALGVIAFELLSGSLPFAASSVPGMMEQHFRAEIPALSTRGTVSTAVDDVVRRALAKDPAARWGTAQDFVDALRVAAGTKAGARMVASRGGDDAKRPWIPAAIGVGVLGLGIVGVIASRGGTEHARDPAAPAGDPNAGTVAIDITSTPDRAAVSVDNHLVGFTPHSLHVKPSSTVVLAVHKPGYLPNQQTLQASTTDSAIAISLGEVTSFQGVWRLPESDGGGLRAFKRQNDQVAVFKLKEVDGKREYYKTFPFVEADTGVAFAADDEVVDDRAPNDPTCHATVHVEYRFDTTKPNTLELRRPHVVMDFVDGHCVARKQDVAISTLDRVDHETETRSLPAPVGVPQKDTLPSPFNTKKVTKIPPPKTIKIDPQADIKKRKLADELAKSKKPTDSVANKPTSTYTTNRDLKENQAPPQEPQQQAPNQEASQAPPQQLVPQTKTSPVPQPQVKQLGGGNQERSKKAE